MAGNRRHNRASSRFKLVLRPQDGSAELLRDSQQVWASDSDEELVEAFGARAQDLQPDDIGDLLDYLVDADYLSDYQADHCFVDPGESETYSDLEDEDMDDEDDDDDPFEDFEDEEEEERAHNRQAR